MKIKMRIGRVGDSGSYDETSFLFRSTKKPKWRRLNRFGESVIVSERAPSTNKTLDPVFEGLVNTIGKDLLPTTKEWKYYDNVTAIMTFKRDDGNTTLVFQKNKPHFYLNGNKMNKTIIMANLARIIYRACYERSSKRLDSYVTRVMTFPPNVIHAMENRTPYSFFEEGMIKHEVMINTKAISDKECALEISDGVWANITVNDLNSFINFHRFKHKRSEKWGVSPEVLWNKLLNVEPTDSQSKMMRAFLIQNRTQALVERRAKELMSDLEQNYPDKIKLFKVHWHNVDKSKTKLGMFVRGTRCDWILLEKTGSSSSTQKVITGRFIPLDMCGDGAKGYSLTVVDEILPQGYRTIGMLESTCIDNVHKNSSLGDQFASRAMTLMNDEFAATLVSTIHLPKMETRIPDEYIQNLDENTQRDLK